MDGLANQTKPVVTIEHGSSVQYGTMDLQCSLVDQVTNCYIMQLKHRHKRQLADSLPLSTKVVIM